MQTLDFRQELAQELINNPYVMEAEVNERRRNPRANVGTGQALQHLPKGTMFKGTLTAEAKTDYPQRKCPQCTRPSGPTVLALQGQRCAEIVSHTTFLPKVWLVESRI